MSIDENQQDCVDRLIGSYRLVRRLGAGGMGCVYEAEHVEKGGRYALKEFTLDHGEVELLRRKFLTEGRLLMRLRHPRLVRVYDLDVDGATGRPYFTMDLVRGPEGRPVSLEQIRRARRVNEEEVARWYADLVDVLNAIHAAGVVHRDVKLENVLLDGEGHAVLADLGISRVLAGHGLPNATTIAVRTPDGKIVLGTGAYLPPELQNGGEATFAVDWYALGVLLFRLLTGVWYEAKTQVFDLLAVCDPAWERVIRTLVAENPAERRALPFAPEGTASGETTVRNGRVSRRVFLAGGLALGAGWAAGAWWLRRKGAAREPVRMRPDRIRGGEEWVFEWSPELKLPFVGCPAGKFLMGCPSERRPNVTIYGHLVTLTRPFWMGKFLCTVGDWTELMAPVKLSPEQQAIGPKMPVRALRSHVLALAAKLTRRFADQLPEGYVFRLPTEAEWEYAFRANAEPKDDPHALLWQTTFNDALHRRETWESITYAAPALVELLKRKGFNMEAYVPVAREKPRFHWLDNAWEPQKCLQGPVGERRPNAWGLHDMTSGGFVFDSLDRSKLRERDRGRFGLDYSQKALVYASEETDPVRKEGKDGGGMIIDRLFAGDQWYKADMPAHYPSHFRLVVGPAL